MRLLSLLDRACAWNGYLRLEITPEEHVELQRDSAFMNMNEVVPAGLTNEQAAGFVGRSGLLLVFMREPCTECGLAFYCACMRAADAVKEGTAKRC